eukprot:1159099-Pelagomonas_calceolata.AAC.1
MRLKRSKHLCHPYEHLASTFKAKQLLQGIHSLTRRALVENTYGAPVSTGFHHFLPTNGNLDIPGLCAYFCRSRDL